MGSPYISDTSLTRSRSVSPSSWESGRTRASQSYQPNKTSGTIDKAVQTSETESVAHASYLVKALESESKESDAPSSKECKNPVSIKPDLLVALSEQLSFMTKDPRLGSTDLLGMLTLSSRLLPEITLLTHAINSLALKMNTL